MFQADIIVKAASLCPYCLGVILYQLRIVCPPSPSTNRVACAKSISPTVTQTLESAEAAISEEAKTIENLSELASKYPYYKYHTIWQSNIERTVSNSYPPYGIYTSPPL